MHDLGRHWRAVDHDRRRPALAGHHRRGGGAEDARSDVPADQRQPYRIGFDFKTPYPNSVGTLEEAIAKVNALPTKPAFTIHTGDISHLSLASQFDDADRIISQTRLDVHYVPGEHDFVDSDRKLYLDRYGRGTKGAGWYSFDANSVHFIAGSSTSSISGRAGSAISATNSLNCLKPT
jgi:hypothetical protein